MGWNDNIKRILDFIPVFERDSKKMGELVQQLTASQEACQAAIKKSEFLEWQNKAIIEKLERLENAPVEVQKVEQYDDSELKEAFAQIVERLQAIKPYNDSELKESISALVKRLDSTKGYDDTEIKKAVAKLSERLTSTQQSFNESLKSVSEEAASIKPYDDTELKKEIARFNELFDSFRRTEGEQAANAINAIGKKVREIGRVVEAIKPYDDTKLIEMVNSFEQYDETKIVSEIKELSDIVTGIKPYNDEALTKQVKAIKKALESIPAPYDDTAINKKIDSIKPFDDSNLKAEVKKANKALAAIKPYDDKQIKKLISELAESTSKMIADHKLANSEEIKDLLSKVEQQVGLMRKHVSEFAESIPEAYDDKQISDRIEKQNEAIKEISGEVSKIKKIFEV